MLARLHFAQLAPPLESESFFPPPEAREIKAAILAAPAFGPELNFQLRPERWYMSLAGPPVQIHAIAKRTSRVPPVGKNHRGRHEPRPAIFASQRHHEPELADFLPEILRTGGAQEPATAIRAL